jgi:hypothetical protein
MIAQVLLVALAMYGIGWQRHKIKSLQMLRKELKSKDHSKEVWDFVGKIVNEI